MTNHKDFRLLVKIVNERGFGDNYLRFVGTFVIVGDDKKLGGCGVHYDEPETHPELRDLTVTAQNNYSADGEGEFYGFAVEYRDVFNVNLERAEEMATALRRITRHMDRRAARFGYAKDMATFAAYAADLFVTDSKPYVRHVPKERDYTGNGYQAMDASGLRSWISNEIATWQKSLAA